MMSDHLIGAASGVVGGALGTVLMQQSMKLNDKLPAAIQPPKMKGDPAELMTAQYESLAGKLDPKMHQTVSRSLHFAYGAGWGALLGLAVPALPRLSLGNVVLAGAAMGAACWGAGFVGWLPAAKLVEPIHRQGATHAMTPLITHVLFGVVTALPLYAIGEYFFGWKRRRLFGVF